jgi:hypothetical protein
MATESYATRREGVEAVGDVIARELDRAGFTAYRVSGARVPVEDPMLPGSDFAGLETRARSWPT